VRSLEMLGPSQTMSQDYPDSPIPPDQAKHVAFLRELLPGPNETQVRKRVISALLRDVVHGRDVGR